MLRTNLRRRLIKTKFQRGAAFIVMLVIMILGVATVLVASLSSSSLKIERDAKTMEALARAKEALIGEAASDVDLANHHFPGSLPCPDTDDDGIANAGGGSECPQYIGRLPWRTLGLPDLRDAAGERLWYTLSQTVRRYDAVRPLNSNVAGTLNITGTYAESNVMAIVFAPGVSLGKSRSDTQLAFCTTTASNIAQNLCAANYLEGTNADPSPGAAPNVDYQSSDAAIEFNDLLITVSHDQLFATVEKRVAREIKNVLSTYYAAWGGYPYAAAFDSPAASTFTGSALPATYSGLLPVGDNIIPTWADAPLVTFSGSGTSDTCELRSGTAINSRWRCSDISISPGETITITGTLNNVGRGLWRPHYIGNICEVRARDSLGATRLVTEVLDNATVTGTLNANGSATVIFQAQGKTGFGSIQRIELRDIFDFTTDIRNYSPTPYDSTVCSSPNNPTSAAPIIPPWLFDDAADGNKWHHVAYYSVAEKFAPGGNHTCAPTPCLTVDGQTGKHALITMTSDIVTGQSRAAAPNAFCAATGTTIAPSACINNYLESENATPLDYIYENKPYSSTFNDQVIVIAP